MPLPRSAVRLILALLSLALIAGACGGSETAGGDVEDSSTAAPTTEPTTVPTTAVPTTEAPTTAAPTTTAPACIELVPEWASQDLSVEEFCEIAGFIEAVLNERFPGVEIDLAEGVASAGDDFFGLQNVVARAAAAPQEDHEAVVAAHFDSLPDPEATDVAAANLRVLFYEDAYFETLPSRPETVEFLPGLQATIVLDTPTAVRTVGETDLAELGLTFDEAFELARSQTLAIIPEPLAFQEGALAPPPSDTDGTFYSATIMLAPEPYLGEPNEFGYLFILPTRDATLSIDLDVYSGGEIAGLQNFLVSTAAQNYQTYLAGPSAITPNMLWWDGEALQLIEVTDSMIQFPEGLIAILGIG